MEGIPVELEVQSVSQGWNKGTEPVRVEAKMTGHTNIKQKNKQDKKKTRYTNKTKSTNIIQETKITQATMIHRVY